MPVLRRADAARLIPSSASRMELDGRTNASILPLGSLSLLAGVQDSLSVVSDASWIVRTGNTDCANARAQQAAELYRDSVGAAVRLPDPAADHLASS